MYRQTRGLRLSAVKIWHIRRATTVLCRHSRLLILCIVYYTITILLLAFYANFNTPFNYLYSCYFQVPSYELAEETLDHNENWNTQKAFVKYLELTIFQKVVKLKCVHYIHKLFEICIAIIIYIVCSFVFYFCTVYFWQSLY